MCLIRARRAGSKFPVFWAEPRPAGAARAGAACTTMGAATAVTAEADRNARRLGAFRPDTWSVSMPLTQDRTLELVKPLRPLAIETTPGERHEILPGLPAAGRPGHHLFTCPGAAGLSPPGRVLPVTGPACRYVVSRPGKSDPLDAVSAARAALSGRAAGAPKGRDGAVAIRALMVVKRGADAERTRAVNQARSLILTGPDDLRARFARHSAAALADAIAALRSRPGDAVEYAVRVALRELGGRAEFLDAQLEGLDELIVPLVTARAPGLLSLYGIGSDTAALLLAAAGDHPARLRSEAAWAHLCGVAPIPGFVGEGPAASP